MLDNSCGVEARPGLQEPNKVKSLPGLTGSETATGICGVLDVKSNPAARRKFIQDLYIRVCRDSGWQMEFTKAAHFAGKVGGFHAMDVWIAMPSLTVMEQIARGEHPACTRLSNTEASA